MVSMHGIHRGTPIKTATEGDKEFNSVKELNDYADENKLNITIGKIAPSTGRTTYRYCHELGRVLEVGLMSKIQEAAVQIQKKHPDYTPEMCMARAEKVIARKEKKKNEKKKS